MSTLSGLDPSRHNFGNGGPANGVATPNAPTPQWPVYLDETGRGDGAGWPTDPLYADRHPQYVAEDEGPSGQYAVISQPQSGSVSELVQFDTVVKPWEGSGVGMTPYQEQLTTRGPVTGRSEGMDGTTRQPDYWMQGQYGPNTGGGTPLHETVAAYFAAQAEQVTRDYAASALFAVQ